MVGQTLGHYRVLEKIGAGGMGEVYRAHDERLDRDVALKLLPEGTLADEGSRKRFRKEALALAKLSHANIGHVYDFDTQDGVDFLVMEYLPGTTLAEQLKSGALAEKYVIVIGAQVAAALEEAHEQGIVHRDLKPGNVMLTPKGQAKVLDFGLARLLQPSGPGDAMQTLTQTTEVVAGTLPYMAPEQLRGETADARTDIYAVGVVLYEMATGTRPFPETLAPKLTDAILHQAPLPPSSANRQVSPAVTSIILKALDKDPERRYQSARELRVDLERLGTPTPVMAASRPALRRWAYAAVAFFAILLAVIGYLGHERFWPARPVERQTLAVLPFHPLGESPENHLLSTGIADAIITRLSNVRQVRLRPTSAVLRYEDQAVDAREVGKNLASDLVLNGTIQSAGERVRVNVQLVRASDATPLWGKQYDVQRGDLLTLEDAIADQVARALKLRLTAAERERINRRYTQNAAAHELYLKGRGHLLRYTRDGTVAAVEAFREALRLDPNYPLAHAGLAMASAQMCIRFTPETEVKLWEETSEREARRALELDPDLAEAHEAAAALYRFAEFDWPRVVEESRQALELNPNLDMPHYYLAGAFYHLGLLELVEPELQAGLEVNPTNRVDLLRARGVAALLGGRFAEATATLEEVQRLSASTISDPYLAQAYYYSGDKSQAEEMLRQLRGSAQAERRAQAALASFLAARGEKAEAERLLRVVISGSYMDHHVAYSIGVAYAQLGRHDRALSWLRRSADTGFPCYPWFARDPLLQPLRRDPELKRLLEELQNSSEQARTRYSGDHY